MKCHQCEKPAVYMVGPEEAQIPLCLDCNLKYVQIIAMQSDMAEREMNYLTELIYSSVGLPGLGPKFPERKAITTGAITLNNIKIDRSTIGVLNTGTIETVDSAITMLQQSGDRELSTAILELSEAVLKNTAVTNETKSQIMEILSFLATEATAPKDKRRAAISLPLLQQLATLLGGAAALAQIWERAQPILESAFSF